MVLASCDEPVIGSVDPHETVWCAARFAWYENGSPFLDWVFSDPPDNPSAVSLSSELPSVRSA